MFGQMRKIRKATVAVVLALMAAVSCPERMRAAVCFVLHRHVSFSGVDVHLLGGGSGVIQNLCVMFF